MKITKIAVAITMAIGLSASGSALAGSHGGKPVNIWGDMGHVSVKHNGKAVDIRRNPNNANTVNPAFAKTSRPCPPFCIQPSTLAPGVETIAEREVMDYAKKMSDGDDSIIVIDSRT
ncbi:MAG: rhodanese-like domain-containing protein, partial [Gammaproteobacteria bacterium]